MEAVLGYLRDLQDRLCRELAALDGGDGFREDTWSHEGGGGGRTRVLEDGRLFEKAGVNFSHVRGSSLPAAASARRPAFAGRAFEATGVSLVLHPLSPHVPTTHMNVRFFLATAPGVDPAWWFGGGFDLTPYYAHEEDARHWHRTAKRLCEPFGETIYPRFKQWCDEYFYLRHRHEPRGIGGLFFDDFDELGFSASFSLTRAIGDGFLDAYRPIVERRRDTPWGDRERAFQLYRRGRYVEYNLVYDRGTLFGLQSGGRVESILMSLPPLVAWHYDWHAEPGSPEARLAEHFLVPREWTEGDDRD